MWLDCDWPRDYEHVKAFDIPWLFTRTSICLSICLTVRFPLCMLFCFYLYINFFYSLLLHLIEQYIIKVPCVFTFLCICQHSHITHHTYFIQGMFQYLLHSTYLRISIAVFEKIKSWQPEVTP